MYILIVKKSYITMEFAFLSMFEAGKFAETVFKHQINEDISNPIRISIEYIAEPENIETEETEESEEN